MCLIEFITLVCKYCCVRTYIEREPIIHYHPSQVIVDFLMFCAVGCPRSDFRPHTLLYCHLRHTVSQSLLCGFFNFVFAQQNLVGGIFLGMVLKVGFQICGVQWCERLLANIAVGFIIVLEKVGMDRMGSDGNKEDTRKSDFCSDNGEHYSRTGMLW